MFEPAAARRVAENLAGIVNGHCVGQDESGVGGDQCIEVDQHTITDNQRDVLARNGRVVALLWKESRADDLGREIDSGCLGT